MENTACTFVSSPLSKFSFGYDLTSYKCVGLKLCLSNYIVEMRTKGILDFYSVCEEGVELWAAEMVLFTMENDPLIRLHCILPHEEQAAKWHSDTREIYYNVLEKASDVIYVNRRYTKDCLAAARYAALDKCQYVFASVTEGEKNEFVRYSMLRGKNVYR